jgi:fatty acid desaturase
MRWLLVVLILGTGLATAGWDGLMPWQRYALLFAWGVTAVLAVREFGHEG